MVETWDVVVAGAGSPGLAFATALRRAAPGARVLVVDPALAAAPRPSFRAVAVAADARRLLDRLGAWAAVEPRAQPIVEMVVTDGRDGDAVRQRFIDFEGESEDGEPFAHMVFADDLRLALAAVAREAGAVLRAGRIAGFARSAAGLTVRTGAEDLRTRLLVAADGSRSRLREAARIGTVGWDYGQSGVVATIAHEIAHDGRATQHFLPGGPLAILPLRAADGSERRFSLVWTLPEAEAARLVALPPADFVAALEARIGFAYGALALEDRPSAHPLRLVLPRSLAAERLALVGDAARTIHPLAGQGLNLGLRDAAVLADLAAEPLSLGLDPGAPDVLSAYERARRPDAALMAGATDGLNRLFSNDSGPARVLRDLGLGLVDRLPALKRAFMREASGTAAPRPPRLR